MDRALVSVEHFGDLAEYLPVVRQHGLGLELQEFSEPGVLDNDWRSLLDQLSAGPGRFRRDAVHARSVHRSGQRQPGHASGGVDARAVSCTTWRSGASWA